MQGSSPLQSPVCLHLIFPFPSTYSQILTTPLLLPGALITTIFYKYIGPFRAHDLSWTFEHGVRLAPSSGTSAFVHGAVRSMMRSWGWEGVKTGGWIGLGVLGVVAGLVAGVAEALGASVLVSLFFFWWLTSPFFTQT